jgi:hypothetical protein
MPWLLGQTVDLQLEFAMHWRLPTFLACLAVGAGCILGCGGDSTGMKNMTFGTEPGMQKELKLKKGNKPLPPEPFGPKAPP